jgi:hypothetical protein
MANYFSQHRPFLDRHMWLAAIIFTLGINGAPAVATCWIWKVYTWAAHHKFCDGSRTNLALYLGLPIACFGLLAVSIASYPKGTSTKLQLSVCAALGLTFLVVILMVRGAMC